MAVVYARSRLTFFLFFGLGASGANVDLGNMGVRSSMSVVRRSLAAPCSPMLKSLFLHLEWVSSTAVGGPLAVDHGVRVAVGARGMPLVWLVRDAGVLPRAPDDEAPERLDLAEY